MEAKGTQNKSLLPWLWDLVAFIACFAAWWAAWQQTHDLEWPCENDLIRDLGAAQSILDGQGGADPAYLIERWWYNPLVPGVVGIVGRALGMPLSQAYATLGTHLNLVAPIGLYAMMAMLATRRAALVGLLGFLFLGPHRRISWLHATYSPWLWTCNFSQGLFYLSVLFIVWALRKRGPLGGIAAGVFVGLTLLAHTAPATLLGVALVVVTSGDLRGWRHGHKTALRALAVAAIICAVATVVAWPFLGDVLTHLRRGVKNAAPMQWMAGELHLDYLPKLVRWHQSVRGWFALLGLFDLVIRARGYCQYARRMVIGWAVAIAMGLAYGYASQLVTLPTFLPSWHFYFYLHALESVLFGFGIVAAARIVAQGARAFPRLARLSPRALEFRAYAVGVGALLVYSGLNYDRYRTRMDLVDNRRDAIGFAKARTVELYHWILNHTDPSDVFLADPDASFYAVAAAGRKVVAMQDLFSNPYLDTRVRAIDRAAMLEQVGAGHWSEFLSAAQRYQVRYVALPATERHQVDGHEITALRRVFAAHDPDHGWDVYAVHELGATP